ncbi:hypothetical protein BUALT_Bualt17G0000700 [Buddleja alternifolia]|uniref:Uncharacterized protein n=1 Tax=Buddleja alternifolia TaxID=168488 RepID=A0AAV6W5A5_9LAMI|nr:hypothetical protein BUALT_Bualt17G0000700 [Buddleja alternifolia]
MRQLGIMTNPAAGPARLTRLIKKEVQAKSSSPSSPLPIKKKSPPPVVASRTSSSSEHEKALGDFKTPWPMKTKLGKGRLYDSVEGITCGVVRCVVEYATVVAIGSVRDGRLQVLFITRHGIMVSNLWRTISFKRIINESNVMTGDDLPFYYFTVKRKIRFIKNVCSSNGKNWKNCFFFVKSPLSRPWPIPRTWKTSKPKPEVEGRVTWPSSFVLDDLTICTFDASVINNERILSMVGVSPTPYSLDQSLAMSLQDAMIENKLRQRKEYLLTIARECEYPLFVDGARNPFSKSARSKFEARLVETAHFELEAPSTDLCHSDAPASDPTRLSSLDKGKKLASQISKDTCVKKAKHSLRSSPSSFPKDQAPPGVSAAGSHGLKRRQPSASGIVLKKRERFGSLSDEEFKASQKLLHTMTKYSNEAREEFVAGLDDKEQPIVIGGEPLQLSCALTTESFVIDSKQGHTTFDLYKSTVLDRDLINLAGMSVPTQEELAAYHGHSFMSYLRSISLHCAYWKRRAGIHRDRAKKNSEKANSFDAMVKFRDEERDKLLASVDGLKTELAQQKKELEDLQWKVAQNQKELSKAQAGLEEKDTKYTALLTDKETEVNRAFSRGRSARVEEFCQKQVIACKGFHRDFDQSELDPCGEVEALKEDPYSLYDPEPTMAPPLVPDLHPASPIPPAS